MKSTRLTLIIYTYTKIFPVWAPINCVHLQKANPLKSNNVSGLISMKGEFQEFMV
jgi:hypothetical protein